MITKKKLIKIHNKIFNILKTNKNKVWKMNFQKIKKYIIKNF